ncbi:unnamed protein product [Cladocopium goreaui]|uniref:Receptor-likey region, transmembrane domain-and RING domain-containing protein 3 n=1 Tax=Cladocopium goreaui TaxID=2562237 RepID=A0A9P1GJU7_9DINO|nr:unnamed protein product [Cladocopium goreaui]
MSRVVSKLQDKATSEGPKPPISEPPNLRARVEHVVQQTLARESSKATGGAKANNANSTSVAVPQSKDGSGSNLRRVLHKIVDDTKFTKSAPPASDRRSKGPKGSKGSVFRHWPTEPEAEAETLGEAAEAEAVEAVAAAVEGGFNLVGFFNDWDAENEPMQGGSWRLSIRNGAPMGSRKGVQREEFQILEDGSWDKRLFPAGGTEETVVLLRPGRPSRAEMSSPETPGHGRNWAVEGKPGAAFKVTYSSKDRSISCEHA